MCLPASTWLSLGKMVVPRISTLSLPPDVGGLVRGSLTLALGNFASERRGGPRCGLPLKARAFQGDSACM